MNNANAQIERTIGVLLPSALSEPFEIALSRIVDLDNRGFRVKAIVCNGTIKGCVSNPLRKDGICRHCRRVRNEALRREAERVELIILDTRYTTTSHVFSHAEAEELEAGVQSTILTFYRGDAESATHQPLRNWLYRLIAKRYRAHSHFVYVSIRELLAEGDVQRLEFFNGRIVPTRAALLAARQSGYDFGVLEVSGRDRQLTVAENNSVHEINFKQEELLRFLMRADLDLKSATVFFESRRNGEETNDKSFTSRQRRGMLKLRDRPILAIFTSSADELKVSGDQWFTHASQNPEQFIIKLSDLIKDKFDVVVRMHPNQAGDKTGAASRMISTISAIPHIQLIPPKSIIATYELLDLSYAVLTFGSTIGLEATYWGKPSILAGRALWDRLDIAYLVNDHVQVANLLNSQLPPRSKEAALGVGAYYLMGTGEPGSLTWRHKNVTGFSVNGYSYIGMKRASAFYWLTRIVDWFLKKY